eukprot:m.451126 g.451126  ORF g.451126 m.451126 type:complete len:989 (+) comp20106_c0_seq1:645-3611(+)
MTTPQVLFILTAIHGAHAQCWGCVPQTGRSNSWLQCTSDGSCCTAVSGDYLQRPQASFPWSMPLGVNHAAVLTPLTAYLARLGFDVSNHPPISFNVWDRRFRQCFSICSNSVQYLNYYAVAFTPMAACHQATALMNADFSGPSLRCSPITSSQGVSYGYVYIDETGSLRGQCENAVAAIASSARGVACGPGQFQGPTLRQCSPCPANTYQSSQSHFATSCISEPFCGRRQFFQFLGAAQQGQCISCPPNTFQNATSHRAPQCITQPTCTVGQRYHASTDSQRTCLPCLIGYFQTQISHRDQNCVQQPPCNIGERYPTNPPVTAQRNCLPCQPHFYMPQNAHRLTDCLAQPPCGPGQLYNDSQSAQRTCTPCQPGTYQSAQSHYNQTCLPQPLCGSGFRLDMSTTTNRGTCRPCPPGTYEPLPSHRATQCIIQPACGIGQRFPSGPLSTTSQRICLSCPHDTYQSHSAHRFTNCTIQPPCGLGQKFVANRSAIRTCLPCPPNTFQSLDLHRSETCTSLPLCVAGQHLVNASSRSQGQCIDCSPGTYVAFPSHRLSVCEQQPPCGLGQRYPMTPLPTNTERVCQSCQQRTFQPLLSHRSTQCSAQPPCGPGHYFHDSRVAQRSCLRCPVHTYQSASRHFNFTCQPQTICEAGEFLDNATSTEPGICVECSNTTFQTATSHRLSECEPASDLTCRNVGYFTRDRGCVCDIGYNGSECQFNENITCSGLGSVRIDGSCECLPRLNGTNCQCLVSDPSLTTCTDCALGYASSFVSSHDCVRCTNHGRHDQQTGQCRCSVGWSGDRCECFAGLSWSHCQSCDSRYNLINGTCALATESYPVRCSRGDWCDPAWVIFGLVLAGIVACAIFALCLRTFFDVRKRGCAVCCSMNSCCTCLSLKLNCCVRTPRGTSEIQQCPPDQGRGEAWNPAFQYPEHQPRPPLYNDEPQYYDPQPNPQVPTGRVMDSVEYINGVPYLRLHQPEIHLPGAVVEETA